MSKNTGLFRVLLFLACLYLVEMAKEAGYISIGIQIAFVIILMILFLFGGWFLKKLKK